MGREDGLRLFAQGANPALVFLRLIAVPPFCSLHWWGAAAAHPGNRKIRMGYGGRSWSRILRIIVLVYTHEVISTTIAKENRPKSI